MRCASAHKAGQEILVDIVVDERRPAIARGAPRSPRVVQNGKVKLSTVDANTQGVLDHAADVGVSPRASFQLELKHAALENLGLNR